MTSDPTTLEDNALLEWIDALYPHTQKPSADRDLVREYFAAVDEYSRRHPLSIDLDGIRDSGTSCRIVDVLEVERTARLDLR